METAPVWTELFDTLTRHWWVLLLRGLIAIAFGVFTFTNPGIAFASLVFWFGAYCIVDGVFTLIATFASWGKRDDRWLLLLESIVSIWAGVVTLRFPGMTAVVLLFMIAAWAMAGGVIRIIQAIRLRHVITGEFWLGLSGVLAIVFASVLIVSPESGAVSLLFVIGAYAVAIGICQVLLSFKLKSLHGSKALPTSHPASA